MYSTTKQQTIKLNATKWTQSHFTELRQGFISDYIGNIPVRDIGIYTHEDIFFHRDYICRFFDSYDQYRKHIINLDDSAFQATVYPIFDNVGNQRYGIQIHYFAHLQMMKRFNKLNHSPWDSELARLYVKQPFYREEFPHPQDKKRKPFATTQRAKSKATAVLKKCVVRYEENRRTERLHQLRGV